MTFGKVRDFVLRLLNQYSSAGTPVAESYNCQADYLDRIPQLVNDAMMEIATTARKIPESLELRDLEPEEYGSNMLRYKLPEDMFEIVTGGVLHRDEHGLITPFTGYRLQGREYILLPRDMKGEFILEYNRYPRTLSDPPAEDEELDGEPITHQAIPYYVAAFLVDHDDAFLYATFYNKYEDKLAKMLPNIRMEYQPINDVYECAFSGGGDY